VYYRSLEYFWRKGGDGKVVFMHVPPLGEGDCGYGWAYSDFSCELGEVNGSGFWAR